MKRDGKIKITGHLVVKCLADNGPDPVETNELSSYVREHGGSPSLIRQSAKWLRNGNVLLVSKRMGRAHVWTIASSEDDIEIWSLRMRTNHYSEKVSQARALWEVKHPMIRQQRRKIVSEAVATGELLGKEAEEVIRDCIPTHKYELQFPGE